MSAATAESAWMIADEALTSAFDLSVTETEDAFREAFPRVEALYNVFAYTESATGRTLINFAAVLVGDRVRLVDHIQPENARGIASFLTTHLGRFNMAYAADEALARAVTADGLWRSLPEGTPSP